MDTPTIRRSLPVRAKIVTALVAFAVLPLLVLGGALWFEVDEIQHTQTSRVEMAAHQINDVIDRNLFERYGDVQAFGYNAAAIDPQNWSKPGTGNPLVVAMNRYMANYGIYKLMLLVSPEGKVLAVNSKDSGGKTLATDALYQKSYANASWLKAALEDKFLKGKNGFTGTVVEQPARHPELASLYGGDDYALVFAAPVTDETDKTIGVWVNFAGFDLVEQIIQQSSESLAIAGLPGAEITLLDSRGVVIVDYDTETLKGKTYSRDWSVLGKLNLADAGVEAAKRALTGKAGGIESMHARKQIVQVAGYHQSTGAYDYPGLKWSALVRVPTSVAYAAINAAIFQVVAVLVVAIAAATIIGLWFGNVLAKPIRRVTTALTDLTLGKVDIDTTGKNAGDELGAALRASEEIRDRIVSGLQTGETLKSITASVMLADADNNIVFVNRTAQELFKEAGDDIRRELPQFDPNAMIGKKIDIFHKNPVHQHRMIAALDKPYNTTITVGVRRFDLTAVPVFDVTGKRLGTAVEWRDMTQQHAVQIEVSSLVEAAQQGDLARRVNLDGKSGFMREIATGINGLLETVSVAVNDVDSVLSALSEGDLGRRMDGSYHGQFRNLQENCNTTIERLRDITGKIGETALNVNSASTEIATGAQDLAQRTESQAASLEQTAAAMHEVTETVRQNAANASAADQKASAARETAAKGGAVVNEAVAAMGEIEQSAQKIGDIIGLIDEIAFQTNLLALNASVEAARAGEAGKGFAVVAQEVRALAQRSANASKDIKALIQSSNAQVKTGVQLVNQTGQSLQEILVAVKQVNDIVAEIATASSEQARAMQEINTAVGQMDEMTQRNGALVEETSAATQTLAHQARDLSDLISFFRDGGETTAERRRETRFDCSQEDSLEIGGNAIGLKNWSINGLLAGPFDHPPPIGQRFPVQADLRRAGLRFKAEAEVVRIDGNFVALKYRAANDDKRKIAAYFA
ncbi:PAS domain-containing protein [Ferrovibrio terrae]|uniref:PAS domain-containing protein n=1 Tax=Ferrovibrio terrae TaxID=2594003 RepID=A0A516GZP4_9PROT|nr:methyl-accepting chemotaxis protein [Ferrovibrio terrae]QDO96965.1 PAS domain-containing protein [Ferrovibrio terrae]